MRWRVVGGNPEFFRLWVGQGVSAAGTAVTEVLGAIPLLAATGELRMPQLYVVAVLTGALAVVSDTASLALLPALVNGRNWWRPTVRRC